MPWLERCVILTSVWFGAHPKKCVLCVWVIEVIAEKLQELYLLSAERCVKLLAMKDAQMCCFRSHDYFYCGSIEKTCTEFWAIMWILFRPKGTLLPYLSQQFMYNCCGEMSKRGRWCLRCGGYYTRVAETEYQLSGSRLLAFKAWLTVCFSQMFSCMMLSAVRRCCWPQKLLFVSEWMCMSVLRFWDK